MADAAQFLAFAHLLADAAGAVIRPYFGGAHEVELKADESPVSRADREAELAMRALIGHHYPDHGIFGEEHGQQNAGNRYTWVIDPIDGTRAFLAGSKEWGTLIALCEDGVPVLGILDQPVTGERWVGVHGAASTYQNQPIHTRPGAALASAQISTTSARYFTSPEARGFVALAELCGEAIENGDCYAYGLLARGARDLVVDAGLKPYDILALVPIIEGAGGSITGWDGAAVTLSHFAQVLSAGDSAMHRQALGVLGKCIEAP